MFTEPSKSPWISISINLFFSKLNLLVIKEFDKGLLTTLKYEEKKTSLQAKMCEELLLLGY
jgi:hypothetical protein